MSFVVVARVLAESEETLARRLMLLVIAEAAGDDGVSWVSQETIAAKARLSLSHVKRSLVEMEGASLETRKAQRGRSRVNVYRVLLPGLPEPDYSKLPFTLTEPFTGSHIDTPSEATGSHPRSDGVSSTHTTGSHPRTKSGPSKEGTIIRTSKDPTAEAESAPAPPPVHKVDERYLAFDVLAAECGMRERSPRLRLVGPALGGENGIRAQFWWEVQARGIHWTTAKGFEQALAEQVHLRAAMYRRKMPRVTLTPGALQKWWTDLPGLPEPGHGDGRLSAADVLAQAQREADGL